MKQRKRKVNKAYRKEFDKAWKDAQKLGVGVFCPILKKRINIETLSFLWVAPDGKKTKPPKLRKEIELRSRLAIIEKIYKEKFAKGKCACCSPYDLKLFRKDSGLFVERLIRAVEICTMKYVLNLPNGNLNINKRPSIIKGRRRFMWED